jgi:hypothetical protein
MYNATFKLETMVMMVMLVCGVGAFWLPSPVDGDSVLEGTLNINTIFTDMYHSMLVNPFEVSRGMHLCLNHH